MTHITGKLYTSISSLKPSKWEKAIEKNFKNSDSKVITEAKAEFLGQALAKMNWKADQTIYNKLGHLFNITCRKNAHEINSQQIKKIKELFKQFSTKKMITDRKKEKKKEQVEYTDTYGRSKYAVHFDRNGNIQSPKKLPKKCLYVVDKYGQLFLRKIKKGIKHSSTFSGRPIAGAGEITFDKKTKKITSINNDSGHYRPKDPEMKNTLTALKRHGVDLSTITVSMGTGSKAVQTKASSWVLHT